MSEDEHPEDSALGRAGEIVARLEQELAQQAQRLVVRAVEEAQDIWAEAQALRRRDTSDD